MSLETRVYYMIFLSYGTNTWAPQVLNYSPRFYVRAHTHIKVDRDYPTVQYYQITLVYEKCKHALSEDSYYQLKHFLNF